MPPTPKPDTYTRIANSVIRRYRSHTARSLLDVYEIRRDFLALDHDFIEFTTANREDVLAVLDDPKLAESLVALFVQHSLSFTYQSNQFIHLNEEEQGIFTAIYRTYLGEIRGAVAQSITPQALETALTAVLKAHFQRLRANIARFFDPETAIRIEKNVILQQAVCEEYSPQLQLDLLNIDPAALLEPVLDLGCGKTGRLVHHLNNLGIRAVGMDRDVEPGPYLSTADWFTLELEPAAWGTILSHMAFSNHFLFHHHYRRGRPQVFASLYMHILSALKPGGAFYYTPGLPFIEQFLPPGRYAVQRNLLPEILILPPGSYASRITRLGTKKGQG